MVIFLCFVLTGAVQAEGYTWTDNSDGTCTITGCWGTGDITIPDTLGGLTVTAIAGSACAQSYSLTGLTIPYTVINIEQGAFSPSGLIDITVVPANPSYSSLDGVLFNKDRTELIQCPAGKAGGYTIPNGVTTIGDFSFYYCFDLTATLTIPDSVTTIGDFAFFYCSGLTGLTIGNSVTTIGNFTFQRCEGLTTLTIGNSVMDIGDNAFAFCDGLTCVIIPDSVTTIGYRGFYDCDSLFDIYFKGDPPSFGTEAFRYVNATAYYLPPRDTEWGATYGGLPTAVWPLSIADVDMDGDVNLWDFAAFAAAWQAVNGQPEYDPLCDISDPIDGVIDIMDLKVFSDHWLITPCQ